MKFPIFRRKLGQKKAAPSEERDTESQVPNSPGSRKKSAVNSHSDEDFSATLVKIFNFAQWLQVKSQPFVRKVDWEATRSVAMILALSFIAASALSTFSVSLVMDTGQGASRAQSDGVTGSGPQAQVRDESGVSMSELNKLILERNLFNSSGELAPEEQAIEDDSTQSEGLDFEQVPCSAEKLPVQVLGTIDTGNPFTSYVTVKDQKVSYADTYKVGSMIIDFEDYEIYKVTRERVEVRKGDQKICVTINEPKSSKTVSDAPGENKAQVQPENVVNLEFKAEELSEGIGPGYSAILNSAKLIPLPGEGGVIQGFKLIAIKPESLFRKMNFQNQDIITEVNGVSLRDASEGFKLYQALQEEREINIRVMRGGVPMTFLVRVK